MTGGTGTAAALPDRPVAGKTGTTENYGDAWFVGYTPQLVTAVWVGYPEGLRPMLTEFHGRAVAGGTFPAQIWKAFMQPALQLLGAEPRELPGAALPLGAAEARDLSRRSDRARQRRCRDVSLLVVLHGPRAGDDGELQARTRSTSRTSSACASRQRVYVSRRSR